MGGMGAGSPSEEQVGSGLALFDSGELAGWLGAAKRCIAAQTLRRLPVSLAGAFQVSRLSVTAIDTGANQRV